MRRCKVCKTQILPAAKCRDYTCKLGLCPSPDCQAAWSAEKVRKDREKAEKAKIKKLKEGLKTRREWIQDAQKVVNAYIRLRDYKRPCISCGRHHQGQYHAGHYRGTNAAPNLRFYTLNIWKQCSVCNNHLSGNAIEYRIALCRHLGAEKVAWIEAQNDIKRYNIDYLQRLITVFRRKIKILKKVRKKLYRHV